MSRMAAQMLYLGDSQLKRISADFTAVAPRYAKLVVAFFTDGKNHPTWCSADIGEEDTATAGVTVRVINKIEDMTLKGTVAVDVATAAGPHLVASLSLLGGSGGMNFSSSNQTFRMARRNTVQTLVHELRHVWKSWTIGQSMPENMLPRRYDQILYQQAYAKEGYNNVFERDAFGYARDWMKANEARVDKGEFDDIVPLNMIRRYAP
jgi:hypothetical protein